MPIELQVIRASEFIRLDARARLNLEQSQKVLQALAFACRKRGLDRAMLDLRALPLQPKPQFTPTELATLVSTFREAGFTRQQRLAVLYQSDIYGGVRTFAFISRMRGLRVQAFTDFERALQWLSEEQENRIQERQGAVPIPVTQRQTEARKLSVRGGAAARPNTSPGPVRRVIHHNAYLSKRQS
jgi:hypothetical protein